MGSFSWGNRHSLFLVGVGPRLPWSHMPWGMAWGNGKAASMSLRLGVPRAIQAERVGSFSLGPGHSPLTVGARSKPNVMIFKDHYNSQ